MNRRVIDVALGNSPADIVVKNGMLVNVLTHEIYQADIAIADKIIAATGVLEPGVYGKDTQVIDAKGAYITPGFIDAHIHIESSMLTFTEFSRMVLPHGTTVIATDLMEIAIVSGIDGVKEVFREAEGNPVKLKYPVPAFMASEDEYQTIGAPLNPQMMEELIDYPQAVGLAEVLYPPILAKSDNSEWMLDLARARHKTAEGHAPALTGSKLNAYCSVGIRSDHESSNAAEALDKLRHGLRILIREGSAATDLNKCIKMLTENHVDARHCSMVSDDIDALHIYRKGHLDHKVRMAIKNGVDPVTAIQMVTLNPAESLQIDDCHGSIAPGKCADLVFLSNLENCTVESVIANGELVVENKKMIKHFNNPVLSPLMLHTVKLSKKIEAEDLVIKMDNSVKKAKVHVIGASPVSLLTEKQEAELPVENGFIQPDINQDVLHIACVERHGKKGGIGRSFINGFGTKSCSIATSVGHDHHNITVVGSDPADMAIAVNRLQELNGGIIIVDKGKVIFEIALPICGLLTQESGVEVAEKLEKMQEYLRKDGCEMNSPYMTLSFITLIFIPFYGITDKGLMDVLDWKIIDPVIAVQK